LDGLQPIIWYKFDDSINLGLDSIGIMNMIQSPGTPLPTYDSISVIKGSGSLNITTGQGLKNSNYTFSDITDAITISFWGKNNQFSS
jgi:hypothetical protein